MVQIVSHTDVDPTAVILECGNVGALCSVWTKKLVEDVQELKRQM